MGCKKCTKNAGLQTERIMTEAKLVVLLVYIFASSVLLQTKAIKTKEMTDTSALPQFCYPWPWNVIDFDHDELFTLDRKVELPPKDQGKSKEWKILLLHN